MKTNKILVFILTGVLVVASLAIIDAGAQQIQLPGSAIPQFVQQLPIVDLAGGPMVTADGTSPLTVTMCEFDSNILPTGTITPNVTTPTRVWGYIVGETCPTATQETYIGPVILATRHVPTDVTWVNNLGDTTSSQVEAWKTGTDQTLHWADPLDLGMAHGVSCTPGNTDPHCQNYAGPIPAVVHLHGGEVPPGLDGGPDSWFTSDGMYSGHGYYTFGQDQGDPAPGNYARYIYPNEQEAANIWFHDHALGITRLNVYAGLAGAYLINDPDLVLPNGLTPYGIGEQIIVPIVIQDRSFDTNGQLFFLNTGLNPEHPFWIPELVADVIVVNGKAWPFMNVEPKRYRFLFLNGSNARTYEMFLTDRVTKAKGPSLWVIGTDGGYLDAPVLIDPNGAKPALTKLVMMPGERYDVIIDFSGITPGSQLLLQNVAKTPFPNGAAPQGSTIGRIMQFNVVPCASHCGANDPGYDPAGGNPIRQSSPADQRIKRLVDPVTGVIAAGVTVNKTRQLTLNEVMGPGGPLEVLVNNTKWSGESPRTYNDFTIDPSGLSSTLYSELPNEGDTEVWEIVNLTADAHPIHLHLVQFQLMSRQNFDVPKYDAVYNAAFPCTPVPPATACTGAFIPGFGPPLDYNTGNARALGGNPDIAAANPKNKKPLYLNGAVMPPAVNEAGWKDTVIMYPGQVTKIAVRWAPTDLDVTTSPANASFIFDPDSGHGYVWHCHIIDHEDNEMMRPTSVNSNDAARGFEKGLDY